MSIDEALVVLGIGAAVGVVTYEWWAKRSTSAQARVVRAAPVVRAAQRPAAQVDWTRKGLF